MKRGTGQRCARPIRMRSREEVIRKMVGRRDRGRDDADLLLYRHVQTVSMLSVFVFSGQQGGEAEHATWERWRRWVGRQNDEKKVERSLRDWHLGSLLMTLTVSGSVSPSFALFSTWSAQPSSVFFFYVF